MAYLREVKSQDAVKKMRIGDLRNEYNALAERYTRITKCDDLVCPSCGRLKTAKKENFYADGNTIHGYYPICKECVFRDAENIEKPTDPPKETKYLYKEFCEKWINLLLKVYILVVSTHTIMRSQTNLANLR